jgi:hypothetical protein
MKCCISNCSDIIKFVQVCIDVLLVLNSFALTLAGAWGCCKQIATESRGCRLLERRLLFIFLQCVLRLYAEFICAWQRRAQEIILRSRYLHVKTCCRAVFGQSRHACHRFFLPTFRTRGLGFLPFCEHLKMSKAQVECSVLRLLNPTPQTPSLSPIQSVLSLCQRCQ